MRCVSIPCFRSLEAANHENEDWINGEKTEDIVAFLDRLYTAKRKVEKRIAVLGGESDTVRSSLYLTVLSDRCAPSETAFDGS